MLPQSCDEGCNHAALCACTRFTQDSHTLHKRCSRLQSQTLTNKKSNLKCCRYLSWILPLILILKEPGTGYYRLHHFKRSYTCTGVVPKSKGFEHFCQKGHFNLGLCSQFKVAMKTETSPGDDRLPTHFSIPVIWKEHLEIRAACGELSA